MPKVKYHISHCNEDLTVNIDVHSPKFVKDLDKRRYSFTFDLVDGICHCDFSLDMKRKFGEYVIDAIER